MKTSIEVSLTVVHLHCDTNSVLTMPQTKGGCLLRNKLIKARGSHMQNCPLAVSIHVKDVILKPPKFTCCHSSTT